MRDPHISRLSTKCKKALSNLYSHNWINTLDVTGQFYQVMQPEHVREVMATRDEYLYCMMMGINPVYGFYCPSCGKPNVKKTCDGYSMLTPLPCHWCMKVGWVLDDVIYGIAHQDDYDLSKITDKESAEYAMETHGVPAILLEQFGVTI